MKYEKYENTKETVTMLVVITLFAIVIEITMLKDKPRVIRYDCSIAEISPDYPIEVKNECRKLMRNIT